MDIGIALYSIIDLKVWVLVARHTFAQVMASKMDTLNAGELHYARTSKIKSMSPIVALGPFNVNVYKTWHSRCHE